MSPISTKITIASHFNSMNIKKIMTYDNGNPGLGSRRAQTCGRLNRLMANMGLTY